MIYHKLFLIPLLAALLASGVAEAKPKRNQVISSWRMVSAQIDPTGKNQPAYGPRPKGLLVFTPDMRFIEVLTDSTLPKFVSSKRGQGTPQENARAMSSSIGFFSTYSVDRNGVFSGNRVEASTFPVRTRKDLQLVVNGDRMTENFRRPDGTSIRIIWQRAR